MTRPILRLAPVAAALFLPTACATPQTQLRDGLVRAGLSKPMATCMADDMVGKLSLTQLMRLRSLSKVGDLDPGETSVKQYMHQVRALKDPEILTVTSRAALGCAIDRL